METTKTIAQLQDAVPLSDGDYLVVNQPNIFNLITQQNGDTRKITVGELTNYNRVVGEPHFSFVDIDPFELARLRWLPLKYQILPIAEYQDLFNKMYCGDSNNALAHFWYKCDSNGTRNINGLFFRVADPSGLFFRIAEQSPVFRVDMNNPLSAPYDGFDVGSFNPDTVNLSSGHFDIYKLDGNEMVLFGATGSFSTIAGSIQGARVSFAFRENATCTRLKFSVPRPGNETAGAWLAFNAFISY